MCRGQHNWVLCEALYTSHADVMPIPHEPRWDWFSHCHYWSPVTVPLLIGMCQISDWHHLGILQFPLLLPEGILPMPLLLYRYLEGVTLETSIYLLPQGLDLLEFIGPPLMSEVDDSMTQWDVSVKIIWMPGPLRALLCVIMCWYLPITFPLHRWPIVVQLSPKTRWYCRYNWPVLKLSTRATDPVWRGDWPR